MKTQKGFTLIELLVVIAIIGLLSTLAVISLNSARSKARDAQRVSDVRQLASLIEFERDGVGTALSGCAAADADTSTCTLPGVISQMANFTDPSRGASFSACAGTPSATCDYTISNEAGTGAPTLEDYQICFYLEDGAGSLGSGIHSIQTGAAMDEGVCS